MKYDIWAEGYLATGMEGIPAKAECFAKDVEADSFVEAVRKWYNSIPNAESLYGKLTITSNGIPCLYTRLFPTETEARASFG